MNTSESVFGSCLFAGTLNQSNKTKSGHKESCDSESCANESCASDTDECMVSISSFQLVHAHGRIRIIFNNTENES